MIEVAAAILERDGKLLICKRGGGGSCAHLWEFPGGKLEPGETPAQCAERECREELGISIHSKEPFGHVTHVYPDREVALTFLWAECGEEEPEASVHEAICWVTPEQLSNYAFCPADTEILQALAQGQRTLSRASSKDGSPV